METKGSELESRLRKRLDKSRASLRKRQKANYELAKDLGFSPGEATVLQNWSEDDIKTIARERGYLPKEKGR